MGITVLKNLEMTVFEDTFPSVNPIIIKGNPHSEKRES